MILRRAGRLLDLSVATLAPFAERHIDAPLRVSTIRIRINDGMEHAAA
jgi:hypothetical protein